MGMILIYNFIITFMTFNCNFLKSLMLQIWYLAPRELIYASLIPEQKGLSLLNTLITNPLWLFSLSPIEIALQTNS